MNAAERELLLVLGTKVYREHLARGRRPVEALGLALAAGRASAGDADPVAYMYRELAALEATRGVRGAYGVSRIAAPTRTALS